MQERTREYLRPTHPGPSSGIFDDPGATPATVVVTHGIYRNELPVGEMSVSQIRARFRDQLDIHPEAYALVDGRQADESARLHAGQTLNFVRPAGEKGR